MDGDFGPFIELAGNARDIVLVIGQNGILRAASSSVEAITGYVVAEVLGENIIGFIHPDDLDEAAYLLANAEVLAGTTTSIDVRVRCADGRYVPFEILPNNLLDTQGIIILTGRNVSERHRRQAEQRQTDAEFQLMATAAPVVIFRIDGAGRCTFMNDQWSIASHQSVNDALGYGYLEVLAESDRKVLADIQLHQDRGGSAEVAIIRPDGTRRTAIARWTAFEHDDEHIAGWVGTVEDISDHRALEARLSYQARHDPLTGLPNRVVINEHLTTAIHRCERSGASVAALFIDLDQFKFLNDSLGHEAGDRLLRSVAERLRSALRASDIVGRFGGDEFVAVLADVGSEQECILLTNRIAKKLAEPFSIGDGQTYTCTASIGIARYTPGANAESLLRDADAAMYRAKALGRDRVEHYMPEMQRAASERLTLEMDLRTAVTNNELALVYQPILATGSGRTNAVEALVRWDHPTRGRIGPDVFIPIAEESGLISQIGDWVLDRACADLVDHHIDVNVNLSGRQVQDPTIVSRVSDVLGRWNFPAERLVLEITESVLMHDADTTAATLTALKALGVSLAVDDFGTGYASLNYLARFPIDCLKVDRSFVAGLCTGLPGDSEIVRAVVNLAHSLGMVATAEGVEDVSQFDILRELGCEQVQGFLFAHPMPLAALDSLLFANGATRVNSGQVAAGI